MTKKLFGVQAKHDCCFHLSIVDKTKVRHHWVPQFLQFMLVFEKFLGKEMIPSLVADPVFSVWNQEKLAPMGGGMMPDSALLIWQSIDIEFWLVHCQGKLTKITLLISD